MAWLSDSDYCVDKKLLAEAIKKNLPPESRNETLCILCKTEPVNTCIYCYFSTLEQLITRLRFHKKVLQEFLLIFNYKYCEDFPILEERGHNPCSEMGVIKSCRPLKKDGN